MFYLVDVVVMVVGYIFLLCKLKSKETEIHSCTEQVINLENPYTLMFWLLWGPSHRENSVLDIPVVDKIFQTFDWLAALHQSIRTHFRIFCSVGHVLTCISRSFDIKLSSSACGMRNQQRQYWLRIYFRMFRSLSPINELEFVFADQTTISKMADEI